MHSNYKSGQTGVVLANVSIFDECGNALSCCYLTICSSNVIKKLVEGWDCDGKTIIASCSFVRCFVDGFFSFLTRS